MSSDEGERHLQVALMSVYYHSLGRRLELSGAPAVLLPPAVRPTPIENALEIVRDKAPDRLHEVLWTMLRSAPPPPLSRPTQTLGLRYPAWLRSFADKVKFSVEGYDETRGTYREESNLFAAALLAYATKQVPAFKALTKAIREGRFAKTVHDRKALGGDTPQQYLESFTGRNTEESAASELGRLQNDVGMTLQGLVNDFADCMAFLDVAGQEEYAQLRAYPTSTVVVQDSQNLTTTVTVTTLAKADDRKVLTTALDPQNWKEFSDAFHEVHYVEEAPLGFKRLPEEIAAGVWRGVDNEGRETDKDLLLKEIVRVPSGLSPTVVAEFENILSIRLHEGGSEESGETAQLTYSLYRSLNSRYLWDERPGGILLDQGYIKVRPLGKGGTWRVTIRKVLRFADRTPSSWGDTPLQFGESLNYLAPAALSWWLQSDMYNAERYARRKGEETEGNGADG